MYIYMYISIQLLKLMSTAKCFEDPIRYISKYEGSGFHTIPVSEVCVFIHIFIWIYTYIYMDIYICIYIYTYLYIYIYIYVYIYIYIYIYICKYISKYEASGFHTIPVSEMIKAYNGYVYIYKCL
jgi:uncharacterized protein YehS (DUF1456 family)